MYGLNLLAGRVCPFCSDLIDLWPVCTVLAKLKSPVCNGHRTSTDLGYFAADMAFYSESNAQRHSKPSAFSLTMLKCCTAVSQPSMA